jgi:hypothetical protein
LKEIEEPEKGKPSFQNMKELELNSTAPTLNKLLKRKIFSAKELLEVLMNQFKRKIPVKNEKKEKKEKEKEEEEKEEKKKEEKAKVEDVFEAVSLCFNKLIGHADILFEALALSGPWICKSSGYLCLHCGSSLHKENY